MTNSILSLKEKVEMYGVEKLSDLDLLASLTGAKDETLSLMIREFKSIPNIIFEADNYADKLTKRQLEKFQLLSELLKRNNSYIASKGQAINSPIQAYEAIKSYRFEKEEIVLVLILNTKNELIKITEISRGNLNSSIVHPREVFQEAIKHNANSIMLAHNHPSGDLTPSREDKQITRRIEEAGKVMGIKLLDHFIIGPESEKFLSFREKGLMD